MAKKVRSIKAGAKAGKAAQPASAKALKKPAKVSPVAAAMTAPSAPRLKKSPLSRAELKGFRLMLLDKRRALIGDMNGMAAEALRTNRQDGSGDLSKIPTHDADVGTDNYEQEFTLGLLESERTLLAEIHEALERIDAGVYGVCMGTGQAIGKERLKARPWAKYCIEYAKLIEKGLVAKSQPRQEDQEAGEEAGEKTDADEVDDVEEEEVEDLAESEKPAED